MGSITKYSARAFKVLALASLVSLGLVGCLRHRNATQADSIASAAPSLGKIRASYRVSLSKYKVHFIQNGQVVHVIIPSDRLYKDGSANLRDGEGVILATIAHYIATYNTIYVQIASYTDNKLPAPVRLALSDRRAQVVGDRIWANGIDARVVTASGLGSANKIDSNRYDLGRRYNRRVVITFKFISDHYSL